MPDQNSTSVRSHVVVRQIGGEPLADDDFALVVRLAAAEGLEAIRAPHRYAERLRALIVDRSREMVECCTHLREVHLAGVIRGLIWALTGEDHGDPPNDMASIFKTAGVPCSSRGNTVEIPNEWLREHGLDEDWNLLENDA